MSKRYGFSRLREFLGGKTNRSRHGRSIVWTKGTENDNMGHHCLVGGIDYLWRTGEISDRRLAQDIIADIIREQYPERGCSRASRDTIINFNDSNDTTWEDVERVLEKADVKAQELFFATEDAE